MDAAFLTAAGGIIGALVGAGALWRANQADRQSLVQTNIRDLWAENRQRGEDNRQLHQELDTERRERAESERRTRDEMAALTAKVERCDAEKNELARQLADLTKNGL